MDARPFAIHIPDEQIADLKQRLGRTRWPDAIEPDAWKDGTSATFARRLVDHWAHRFDWRAQEARLNRLPQYRMAIDGLDIHFVHQPGRGPAPLPLVMTHGWPGSFVEMERILPLLTDPAAHGGDAADAFHLVVPSLPGFGFSPAPTERGTSARAVATRWAKLMRALGYERFGAQGGDIGSGVSTWLACQEPERLVGAHLNYMMFSFRPPLGEGHPPVSAEEQAFLDRAAAWAADHGAYSAMQGTRPQTLAYALTDSPAGLAAWIVEKFHDWSDHGGELETSFSLDALLTDISLYWFGGTAGAFRMYQENRRDPLAITGRVTPPIGFAHFPRELPTPPRSWLERVFDVRRWTEMPHGGHFAAMEQPELLAREIRAFFRPLRQA